MVTLHYGVIHVLWYDSSIPLISYKDLLQENVLSILSWHSLCCSYSKCELIGEVENLRSVSMLGFNWVNM